MSYAWFICTYKRRKNTPRPIRYCAMDDFTKQINDDGGDWAETEVLGNYAIVKVRASDATLDTIANTSGFFRLPLNFLDASLSSLTGTQRTNIKDRLLAMGYTADDVTTALGSNLSTRTLGEVLRFAASRRLKPRYDAVSDQIVLDGEVQACKPIDDVDREVV